MTIASTMTAYITSNFITGESLEENVRIEATIVGVREHDFEGDVRPTVDSRRRVAASCSTRISSRR